MNIHLTKKKKKLFPQYLILLGLTSLLILNSLESVYFQPQTSEFPQSHNKGTDIQYNVPITSDSSVENIIFQDLPNTDLLDNTEIINNFYNYLEDDTIIYDRPPSIIATYFIVSMLASIDPTLLLPKTDKILDFLVTRFNPATEKFEENVNYTYYNQLYNDGKDLLLAPYTPEITHEMALVVLAKCNKLSTFSSAQITNWITEIWSHQNIDGGFGTLYSPNSTLLETYYAIESLLALNNLNPDVFPSIQKNAIQSFIASRQRTGDWATVGIGAFGEYSEDLMLGWEFFYASWLALNSIEMIEGDVSTVKDDFISFLLDSNLNNPSTHCFYGQWNDKASPDIITYYGTAILGDCIRIVEAEPQFPDIYNAQSTLISANLIENTGLDLEYNYFYWASDVPGDDLFSQFLIVKYLTNLEVWNLVDDQEFLNYYLSFLTEIGGGTYISNIWNSSKGDYLKFNALKYSGINESQVYDIIMSRKFATYFGDLRNISSNPQDQSYKMLLHWNEWAYYPIATNYFSLQLLEEYDLLDDFSTEVGSEYTDFIWWIHGKLTPEGYFSNSPEYMVSGNLESTYYALESQKILLDYDPTLDILDYYTLQERNSVLLYCEQFIEEDSNFWFVNCSDSLENHQLGRFQSLKYVVSIEEILGGNGVDYAKLEQYLVLVYETQWDTLKVQEKSDMLYLLDKIASSYSSLSEKISHEQIRTQILYIISQDHYPENEVDFIAPLLKDSTVMVYMEIPANLIIDESYTYLAQFSSVASLISVENISISDYNNNFNNWYSWGSMVGCEVIPRFHESTPYSWDVFLEFGYRGNNYSYPFSVDLSIPFSSNVETNYVGSYIITSLSVESPDSLISVLEPELFVYDFDSNLVGHYHMSNMTTIPGLEEISFECEIVEQLHDTFNYTLIWEFNYDFLDNISIEFTYIENIPPTLYHENATITGIMALDQNLYQYNFSITYSDPESNPPEYVRVILNDTSYLMEYQTGDYKTGAKFGCDMYLEVGTYTYYFIASDGRNVILLPETDQFYLSVTDLSDLEGEPASTKIGNYIIETILSLGSVGAGVSGVIFKNKQKIYQKILSTHV
uniref:Prenyltransferase alpha-alpha toroid domain-containing protein n=1 Tax=Promethearchaeum syntrophicum TaxID=2594042 RepID=A0A5B9DEJ9_9ARCH|nr:hypothetical protein [Candidatus Prometheoarchaeum syntrophicum]QEE17739.1 hypothetical protein DSAG12_03577 [Candidatus Prometheoarchaeum syntrophicum]